MARNSPGQDETRREEPTLAFGLVVRCRRRITPTGVLKILKEFASARCQGSVLGITQETDWGSLVSARPEKFYFLQAAGPREVYSFCRFRQVEGGYEFLFNLKGSEEPPQQIERYLTGRLRADVVKREFF